MHTKFPVEVHEGSGQNFPIFIYYHYLVELGPDNWVYRLPRFQFENTIFWYAFEKHYSKREALHPTLFSMQKLGAQQRYFSCHVMFAAVVSQDSFVRIFNWVSHNCRVTCCKMGYRTDVPV